MSRVAAPAAVAALVGLAACSADAGDFQSDAEKYINDNAEVSDELGDVDFSDAECERPLSADAGTTFTCVAAGDDGNVWRFTAEIVSDDEYQITEADTIPGRDEGGTDTSAPPSSMAPAESLG